MKKKLNLKKQRYKLPMQVRQLEVIVNCIDGTNLSMGSTVPKDALAFLKKNDHEGSCISLKIIVDEPHSVYSLLERLCRT